MVRTNLSMVSDKNLCIQQMDIKGAYLNGILKEDVYMRQPEGYRDGSDKVCRLIKTLYRLKQSGHEWNIQFDKEIQCLGFTQLLSDPCTYIQRNKRNFQIITVWVNDLLPFADTESDMQLMKAQIVSKWQVTDLGKPSKIIGIKIMFGSDYIAISQKQYIESILCKENMEKANPVATPLDLNVPIEPNPDESDGDCSNPFARLLGKLQYLANATRLDIAFAVNRLASYTANPSTLHYSMRKRILRYLTGTRKYRITY
jgi:hypothetical protein